jgi:hypothetical protein
MSVKLAKKRHGGFGGNGLVTDDDLTAAPAAETSVAVADISTKVHGSAAAATTSSRRVMFYVLLVLAVMAMTSLLFFERHNGNYKDTSVYVQEYTTLMQQAHALIERYQVLTNKRELPGDLVAGQLPELSMFLRGADNLQSTTTTASPLVSGTQSIAGETTSTDLVLGMAQDTDPKNLVSLCGCFL